MSRQRLTLKGENAYRNTMKYGNDETKRNVLESVRDGLSRLIMITILTTAPIDIGFVVLISAYTQAGKTQKTFELLQKKLFPKERNLVLYVTQANLKAPVIQTMSRAQKTLESHIPESNYFTDDMPNVPVPGSVMLINFWDKDKMKKMIKYTSDHHSLYDTITVIIDEIEQNAVQGVKSRLDFIQQLEDVVENIPLNVIFVTATVANLSKCIDLIGQDETFVSKGIVKDIITKPIVQHHHVAPSDDYLGMDDIINDSSMYQELVFPKRERGMRKEEYRLLKEDTIIQTLKSLPNARKRLPLVATTSRKHEHDRLAKKLVKEADYNIAVKMNSETNGKNYIIKYRSTTTNEVKEWELPYKQLCAAAKKGRLARCNIHGESDFTLLHTLQAALFEDATCFCSIGDESWQKLRMISSFFQVLRPDDFPIEDPRVALVAGNLASRGVTFQDSTIGFVCTSCCFSSNNLDTQQRGASDTQKLGRACGKVMAFFNRPGNEGIPKPIIIAPKNMMSNAYANIKSLEAIVPNINGEFVCLKDMIPEEDWQHHLQQSKYVVQQRSEMSMDNKMLQLYYRVATHGYTRSPTTFTCDDVSRYSSEARRIEELTHDRKFLKRFNQPGSFWRPAVCITSVKTGGRWYNTFTPEGIEYVRSIS